MAQRTGEYFAIAAKKNGKVVSVTDTGILIEYEDGEQKGYELGRKFGNAAGLTIPHNITTELQEGKTFKAGDIICYNDGFFEKDFLNPSNVVMKMGLMANVALLESGATIEDSSALTPRLSALLSTKVTKVKNVIVNFNQGVRNIVKAGSTVSAEDILCVIEDEVTANTDLFDDVSMDTLRVLSAQTPQAKADGVVERIEVYYHGDKEDMSPSLLAIANASDRAFASRHKSMGKKAFTGSVNDGFRIDGNPLSLDSMATRFYITSDVNAGDGDKFVFGNQMKSVSGSSLSDNTETESGMKVDAIFSANSVYNRIVNSCYLIGTTATLLDLVGKKAVGIYKGK